MKSIRKNQIIILVTYFLVVCQIDINWARPNGNHGNHRNSKKNREVIKGKRNWPDTSSNIVSGNVDDVDTPIIEHISILDDSLAPDEIKEIESSSSTSSSSMNGKSEKTRKWLELDRVHPETISARLNADLTLECIAVGSPPPAIHWLKDGQPIDIGTHFRRELNHVYGTIPSTSEFSMANVKSKIPLRCIRPKDIGTYTCVAQNKGRKLFTEAYVVIDDSIPAAYRTECDGKYSPFSLNKKGRRGQPAFIHSYEYLHMETMGSDTVLTCQAGGKPKPSITWFDYDGKEIINGKKFWKNSSGNLVINNLSWSEMGEYTCRAENEFGSDSGSTFLYPLSSESSS